ncbi:MAG: hydrogenase iron-sulfur subunit [Planctomycetes bacterium]|nr:hydrogenase iron-sulfur subunit [Planctomycetota bacterium]
MFLFKYESVKDRLRIQVSGKIYFLWPGRCCLEGECHYLEGNLRARKRVTYVKKLLTEVGTDPQRVEMFNLSSAMGGQFAEYVEEMTKRIKEIGPANGNGQKEPQKQ